MKLDLCKIFNIEEKQHFWISYYDTKELDECYIEDNKLWSYGEDISGALQRFDIFSVKEIYYEKPIILDEKTKQFLKLIEDDFNIICRIDKNKYMIKDDFNNKNDFKINSIYFKIDLSMLELNKEYYINDLLKDKK